MPARSSGQIHKATRYHQSNVAALEAGGGIMQQVAMPKKAGRGPRGQKKKSSKTRELNDQLKNL